MHNVSMFPADPKRAFAYFSIFVNLGKTKKTAELINVNLKTVHHRDILG